MRKLYIDRETLKDEETKKEIVCWNDNQHLGCFTSCSAFAQVMFGSQQNPTLVAACAAMPQMIPMGSLGEPSQIVPPPPTLIRV
jgi:hypothetical protein